MFKENDIRPLEFAKNKKENSRQDIEFLLSFKDEFHFVYCPSCNTKNNAVTLKKNGFDYMECENCTMMYLNPRPSMDLLKTYYANSKNHQFFKKYIYPASEEVRRKKIFKPRVDMIIKACKKLNAKRENILEIGPGYGLFLEEITKKRFFNQVVGVEASDTLYEKSKKQGFKVYNGIFEQIDIKENFDVIVSFEVIEHIFNPKELLEKCLLKLNTNGLVMMTFPNLNGFDVSILKELSDTIGHTHLNYFNEKSISLLLENLGFKNIKVSTPGVLDVDLVRNKISQGLFKPNNFINDLCINSSEDVRNKFQKFLIQNNMSSNMMIIAQK